MFCKACGTNNEEGVAFCKTCGSMLSADEAENGYEEAPVAVYKDSLGLASLIVSIVSLVCLGGGVASVVAIILGIIAKKNAAAAGSSSKNGLIGTIIGIVGVVLYMLIAVVGGIFVLFCVMAGAFAG